MSRIKNSHLWGLYRLPFTNIKVDGTIDTTNTRLHIECLFKDAFLLEIGCCFSIL
jgi:hypothetical protein